MRSFSRPSTVSARAFLAASASLAVGEHLQQLLQRIVALAAAVEDQVLGDLHLLRRDQMQRPDLRDMHDRAGHAGPHRMVEEHRVQHRARRRVQAEADVGQAEDDLDVREIARGSAGCPPASIAPSLRSSSLPVAMVKVSGSISRSRLRQAVLVAGEIDQPRGDRAACRSGGLRHAHLVDGQRDHRGAELLRQHQPVVRARCSPSSKLIELMIGLPPCSFSAALDHRRLGAVDHQRRVHRAGEAADHLVHLRHLVAADEGGADIEAVGAFADLLAAHRRRSRPSRRFSCSSRHFFEPLALQRSPMREIAVLLAQRHLPVQAGDRRHPDRACAPPAPGGSRRAGAASRPAPAICGDRRCRSSRRSG